jgi:hypothetical protein
MRRKDFDNRQSKGLRKGSSATTDKWIYRNGRPVYNLTRRRWYSKKIGTRWGSYVLGRRRCSIRLLEHGELVVSAYKTQKGDLRYTDPVTSKASKAGPGVLYRVRVKLKQPVAA